MLVVFDFDGLDGDVHDVGELLDDDFDFGVHAGFEPGVGAFDVDGAGVDFEAGGVAGAGGVREDGEFGDFALEDLAGFGVDGDEDGLADADFFDLGFVDVHGDAHLGHVGDGEDGLAEADGGAFFDGLGVAGAGAGVEVTVGDEAGGGGDDAAGVELALKVFFFGELHVVAAFGGLVAGFGLGHFGAVGADGAAEFVEGFAVGGDEGFALFGELVFFEEVELGFGGFDEEGDFFEVDLVVFELGFGDEVFGDEALGGFDFLFGDGEFGAAEEECVSELAELLLGCAIAAGVGGEEAGEVDAGGGVGVEGVGDGAFFDGFFGVGVEGVFFFEGVGDGVEGVGVVGEGGGGEDFGGGVFAEVFFKIHQGEEGGLALFAGEAEVFAFLDFAGFVGFDVGGDGGLEEDFVVLDSGFEFGVVEFDEDFLLLDVFFGDEVAFGDEADDFGADFDFGLHFLVAEGADFAALEDIDLEVALLDFEGGDVGGLTGVGGAEPSGYGTDEEDASGDEG